MTEEIKSDELSEDTLYPAKASLGDAKQFALAHLPITTKNQLLAVLATYANTVRKDAAKPQETADDASIQ